MMNEIELHYKGYVSEDKYIKATKLAKEKEKQLVGYEVSGQFYTYSRDTYKTAGLIIVFAGWVLSHIYAPAGIMVFGIGLCVYFSAPSGPTRKVYLCDKVKWQRLYTVSMYKNNECPSCDASLRMEHKLVTKCPKCNLTMCKFGADLKTAITD